MTNQQLIFLHIPKTAGVTFSILLEKQYGKKSCITIYNPRKTEEGLNTLLDPGKKMKVLTGHLNIKPILEHSSSIDVLTLMRDPYKHTFSYYSFVKEKTTHHFYELINKNNISLKQALKEGVLHLLDNFQVRCLTGNQPQPFGSITQSQFEEACYNLDNHIRYFGFTEKFGEFVAVMQLAYGWRFPVYRVENATKHKLAHAHDQELEDLIAHHTRFDRALYAYALKRYEEQNQQFGDALRKKTQRLEFWNNKYQKVSNIKRKLLG